MHLEHEVFSSKNVGLAWKFCVSPISCDNPVHYENYLCLCAVADANSGQAVSHVLIDRDTNRIAGYVALRATSLISAGEQGTGYVHPAIEIAELAVDKEYERHGVGKELVGLSILISHSLRLHIGIKSVLVCADPKAISFYQKMDFEPIRNLYNVLYDGWNNNCEPMYISFEES